MRTSTTIEVPVRRPPLPPEVRAELNNHLRLGHQVSSVSEFEPGVWTFEYTTTETHKAVVLL